MLHDLPVSNGMLPVAFDLQCRIRDGCVRCAGKLTA